jgi:hypothetical protein
MATEGQPCDLKDEIRSAASSPARMSGDSGSVDQRSIDDLIKADRYLAQQKAAKRPLRGVKLLRVENGGAS